MPMATKFGTVVTNHDMLPPTKSCGLLMTLPCEITLQTKTITTTLPE